MKKMYFSIMTALLVLWIIPAFAAPSAVISDALYEFETVREGESVLHGFVIQNTGDTVLEIKKVVPG